MTITVISTIEAKEQFTDLINRVAHDKERVIITRRGKEIAAVISLEDLYMLEANQDQSDVRDAIEALQEVRQIGNISLEKLKAEFGI